jgi:UDP-N-acetyl-D-glucosamine 2-epimerase, UDP-hydrolysing
MKKILFVTGTRADYGKIKSLMKEVLKVDEYELQIFITGMHMLSKYGSTHHELEKDGFQNLYKYINQTDSTSMDLVLSNTILGISNYVNEYKIDLIVVHGDRVEALAGAIVGALNNIRVAHVEGGEVSGTIDESIRHAITKFSHIHFVANEEAKKRLIQLGEEPANIYVIGSPDIDVMLSESLPTINEVKNRYEIVFDEYAILMHHPVTTESEQTKDKIKEVVDAVLESNRNYVVIYPNNDSGSNDILNEYKRLQNNPRIKIFPSIKFEYFLSMLKHAEFIIGNSSAGIREAGIYRVPAIDIGTRQTGRYVPNTNGILHTQENKLEILKCIETVDQYNVKSNNTYGEGNSSTKFIEILKANDIWECDIQKRFIDVE